jgi:uncharacterized protein
MKLATRRDFLRTGAAAGVCRAGAAQGAEARAVARAFPAGAVLLGEGPLRERQERNRAYLASLEADRLLHNFRRTAGLPSTARPLGGWESPKVGLRGHFVGHYLAACALASRTSADGELAARASYLVKEMARCQEKLGNGYLGAFPETAFDTLETRFSGAWAPYYTLHKIMAGLLAVYTHCGNRQALEVCTRLADYTGRRMGRLDEATVEKLLFTVGPNPTNEFGGMSEVLHDLYAVTGEAAHLKLAHRFDREWFLGPLARGEDNLANLHANTHIPQVLGAARHYELTGYEPYRRAALFFWDQVAMARSYITGGSSGPRPAGGGGSPGGEHWGEPYRLAGTLTPRMCESCVVHNLLRLTDRLFRWTASPRYADYAERALFNSVLGMQHPRRLGGYVYEQALGGGSRKFYGGAEDSFWCCYGTSVEAFASLAAGAYYYSGDALWVNQFVASVVDWSERGVRLEQQTKFPDPPEIRLIIHTDRPCEFTLHLRIPEWTSSATPILLNGSPVTATLIPGSYLPLRRTWAEGDTLCCEFPVALRARSLPDDPRTVAVEFGPLVMAVESPDELVFAGLPHRLLASARRESIAGPRFSIPVQQDKEATLTPLYGIVEEPYGVYLTCYQDGSADLDRELARLRQTVDRVAVNDPRSETAHELRGEQTTGEPVRFIGGSRRAAAGGWFSYRLRVRPEGRARGERQLQLRASFVPPASEVQRFEVLVEGTKVGEPNLGPVTAPGPVQVDWEIPGEVVQGKESIQVTFRARSDAPTGRLCDLRLMRRSGG